MSDKIRSMFASISDKYDILNDILSFGMHRCWKKKLIKISESKPEQKVLDIATGTGDIAFLFADKNCSVTGIDLTPEMIEIARKRSSGYKKCTPEFMVSDAQNLPFGDSTFDLISISFGIRNLDDYRASLREMHRVLKSRGKIVILEFGQPLPPFSYFYNFYSKYFIPIIGKIVSGSNYAYSYLPETAAKFPADERFVDILKSLKLFNNVTMYRLMYGVAYIYMINKL